MPIRKIAVICTDELAEMQTFCEWLSRNRRHVIGASENYGCGCCVDIFDLEIADEAEPMPCECSGEWDASRVMYGPEKEKIIDRYLALSPASQGDIPTRPSDPSAPG